MFSVSSITISLVSLFLSLALFFYTGAYSKLIKFLFTLGIFISGIFYLAFWVANRFTGNGITEGVIYHLKTNILAAGLSEYFSLILISAAIILALFIFSVWLFFFHSNRKERLPGLLVVALVVISLFSNPTTAKLEDLTSNRTISQQEQTQKTGFYKYYKKPQIKQTSGAKNLVFIYAEGLERTYFNKKTFPNLVPNLRKFEDQSISFRNITQDRYSSYTMGGMVASQCGFPLVSPSHGNAMSEMDSYLESATCLGDLLKRQNYYLSYMGGASLKFGGKGMFFRDHGFDEMKGLEQLGDGIKNKNKNEWGINDDVLFDKAYKKFTKLSEEKDRFGLFLLTLGTHHPSGHLSQSCRHEDYNIDNPMLKAVKCSDKIISKFIKKIRKSDYSDDTTIVLASDHLSLPNKASDLLEQNKRRNLFIINTPNKKSKKIDKPGGTLDIGTTILPYIGFEGTISLGRNLSDPTSRSNIRKVKKNLTKWKPYFHQFWNFPKIRRKITIKPAQERIKIDNREFNIPVLIELSDEFETKLRFEEALSDYHPLNEQIGSIITHNKPFILIEKCTKMNEITTKKIKSSNYCIMAGKGNNKIFHKKIPQGFSLTKQKVSEIVERDKK